jgi:hypothetical protein
VTTTGEKLYVAPPGEGTSELYPASADRFFLLTFDIEPGFQMDTAGNATGAKVKGAGFEFTAKKIK